MLSLVDIAHFEHAIAVIPGIPHWNIFLAAIATEMRVVIAALAAVVACDELLTIQSDGALSGCFKGDVNLATGNELMELERKQALAGVVGDFVGAQHE